VVIWLVYTLVAVPAKKKTGVEVALRSNDLNYALERARVAPVDGLLESMESTVERLLYPPEDAKAEKSSPTPV
jgi:hypothetical protein